MTPEPNRDQSAPPGDLTDTGAGNSAKPATEALESGGRPKDRQSSYRDLVREIAEDLRIIGKKGKEFQSPPQADGTSARTKRASSSEIRRSILTSGPTMAPSAADARSRDDRTPGRGGTETSRFTDGNETAAGDKRPFDTASQHTGSAAPYGSYYHGELEQALEDGVLGSLHPFRVLRVAKLKWQMMLLVQVLAIAGAWFYLSTVPKIYRATSLIEMSLRRPRIMSQQGAVIEDQSYAPSEEVFNTRLAKFNGNELRDIAFVRFKALYPAKNDSESKLRSLMGTASFSLLNKTKLVQITCFHSDKTVAPIVANAFMEAAEQFSLEENRSASDKAVAWLEAQARTQRDLLEKAEQTIAKFRTLNNIDALENAKKSAEESAISLGKSLVDREGEAILLQDIVRKIQALDIKPESAGNIPDSIPRQAEIKAALERWVNAIAERDSLLLRYTPQHPGILAKNETINLLWGGVGDAVRLAHETARSNLDLLKKQIDSLRAKSVELDAEISQLNLKILDANSRLTGLQRERDACDVSYRGILNRIEEARLAADEDTASVKVVERASEPRRPFKPQPAKVFPIAIFVGLGIGLGLALLADTLEDRISSADDVERRIGLRILGLVPHVPRAMREDIVKTSITDKRGHISEVFAGIRVLLNSRQYADMSKSLLLISSGPEDGKTVTACSLAIACAQGGARTLLVDFDLRRPRIGRIFGIPDGARLLAEALIRRDPTMFPQLPQSTACENLHVVAARVTKNINPADIFGGGFVSNFVEWAQANYDRVILDAAPFGSVSDSMVLAGLVDSVIVVCRPMRTRKQSTRFMLRNLTDVGANIIGAVINDVDFSKNPYFSNYYHQYHYNYTYGDRERKNSMPEREPQAAGEPAEPKSK